jgi:hypothetical protein
MVLTLMRTDQSIAEEAEEQQQQQQPQQQQPSKWKAAVGAPEKKEEAPKRAAAATQAPTEPLAEWVRNREQQKFSVRLSDMVALISERSDKGIERLNNKFHGTVSVAAALCSDLKVRQKRRRRGKEEEEKGERGKDERREEEGGRGESRKSETCPTTARPG